MARRLPAAVSALIAAALVLAGVPSGPAPVYAQSVVTVAPGRILDTRATGVTVDGQHVGAGVFGAGETRVLPVAGRANVPASGVAAVAVNITAINPSTTSFVTAFPTGSTRPNASNLNLAAGRTLPNMAIVPLGTGGSISLFNNAGTTHLAVDVMGWFGQAGDYTPVAPGRLLDTRATGVTVDGQQQAGGVFGPGETRSVPIAGRGGVPAFGATAVAVNITAVNPSTTSFVTVFPSGTTRPNASNLNLVPGQTIPNMAIVTLGANGAIDLFNSAGTTNLIVDVMGWFALGGDYTTVAPGRLLDTRPAGQTVDGQQQAGGVLGAGATRTLPVAGRGGVPVNGVAAVAVNITAVAPSATSFVTAFPAGTTRPNASNLNLAAGRTLPNMAIVPLGLNGSIELFNSAGTTHLLVDVVGWFPPDPAPSTVLASIRRDSNAHPGLFSEVDVARDGGFAAFTSSAANLVPGDTNGVADVFVVDLTTRVIERVSVHDDGTQLTAASGDPAISDDGRFVTFTTAAPAAANDVNALPDVFRRDTQTDDTVIVSLQDDETAFSLGAGDQDLSGDGNVVAFTGVLPDGFDAPLRHAYVRTISSGATELMSGNFTNFSTGAGDGVSISEDGDKVAFTKITMAQNRSHIFRYDVSANTFVSMTTMINGSASLDNGGSSPVLSDDGVAVVYRRSLNIAVRLVADGLERVISTSSGASGHRFAGNSKLVVFATQVAHSAADTNGTHDVYTADPAATPFTYTLLSTSGSGGISSGFSFEPAMSADRGTLVMAATGTDLVPGSTTPDPQHLVMKRNGGYTMLSAAPAGVSAMGASFDPLLSADGRFVVYRTLARDVVVPEFDVFTDLVRLDRQTGVTIAVDLGDDEVPVSEGPIADAAMSADGNRVAFLTSAPVRAQGLHEYGGGLAQIYVRDISAGTTVAVSQKATGVAANNLHLAPAMSGNGRFVVFQSIASDLVAGDTNSRSDVFLRDLQTGTLERVSLTAAGGQVNGAPNDSSMTPAVSYDGRYVTWTSSAENVVPGVTTTGMRVYRRDRVLGTTELVANGISGAPSADGRLVAFASFDSTLVPNDTNGKGDVFVKDMGTGTITRVSVATGGAQGTGGDSGLPMLSLTGRFVTFLSSATDLVAGDGNGVVDLFLHDRLLGTTVRVNVSSGGTAASGASFAAAAPSASGRYVVFESAATNLASGDVNALIDVFIRDLG